MSCALQNDLGLQRKARRDFVGPRRQVDHATTIGIGGGNRILDGSRIVVAAIAKRLKGEARIGLHIVDVCGKGGKITAPRQAQAKGIGPTSPDRQGHRGDGFPGTGSKTVLVKHLIGMPHHKGGRSHHADHITVATTYDGPGRAGTAAGILKADRRRASGQDQIAPEKAELTARLDFGIFEAGDAGTVHVNGSALPAAGILHPKRIKPESQVRGKLRGKEGIRGVMGRQRGYGTEAAGGVDGRDLHLGTGAKIGALNAHQITCLG